MIYFTVTSAIIFAILFSAWEMKDPLNTCSKAVFFAMAFWAIVLSANLLSAAKP